MAVCRSEVRLFLRSSGVFVVVWPVQGRSRRRERAPFVHAEVVSWTRIYWPRHAEAGGNLPIKLRTRVGNERGGRTFNPFIAFFGRAQIGGQTSIFAEDYCRCGGRKVGRAGRAGEKTCSPAPAGRTKRKGFQRDDSFQSDQTDVGTRDILPGSAPGFGAQSTFH
jgi:hypothetical protein